MSTDPNTGARRDQPFFSAFVQEKQKRPKWVLPAALSAAVFVIALTAFLVRPDPQDFQVVTPYGMRTVTLGMSQEQVGQSLGKPIGIEERNGQQCLRFGFPNFEAKSFVVHTACFEGGRLRELTQKRYRAEKINPQGLPIEE